MVLQKYEFFFKLANVEMRKLTNVKMRKCEN